MLSYDPVVLIKENWGNLEYDMPRHELWFCNLSGRTKVGKAFKSSEGLWLLTFGSTTKSFQNLAECARWMMENLKEVVDKNVAN